MRSRRGVTLIELMVVVTIIGLVTRIAMPRFNEMRSRATAASVVGDVHAVRVASYSYYAEAGQFPAIAANGKIPTELTPYLPKNFSFKKPVGTYRWYVWKVTTGKGKTKVTETLVGVRVTPTDKKLINHLSKMSGAGFAPLVTANNVTFLLGSG
jgi:prepilin-type N-terminal cleavage/methylation domain-containing protein